MKTHLMVLFATMFSYMLAGEATAQWVPMTPLYSADVLALAANGANIFAGMDNGVFLSTDGVASWKASGLAGSTVRALFVTAGNVFAGTDSGIFLSTDNGSSWNFIGLGTSSVGAFCAIGARVFAGTRGRGIFVSSNGGGTWNPTAVSGCSVPSLAVSGNDVFATVPYGGVFVTSDSGTTWTPVSNGLTTTNVAPILVNGSDLYVGSDLGVFHSSNDGALWKATDPAWNEGSVASLAIKDGNLVAGTSGNGILYSTDGGASWNSSSPTNANVLFLATLDSAVFAGTVSGGVFRSTDDGETWAATGLTNSAAQCLAASGGNLFEGTDGGGVFRSSDDGETWTAVNSGLTCPLIYCLAANDSTIYAGTYGNQGGVFRSTNSGKSWSITGLRRHPVSGIAMTLTTLIAGGPDGLYISTNEGTFWNRVLDSGVEPVAVVDTNIFAGSANTVFVSTNNGLTWTQPWLSGYDMSVDAIAFVGVVNVFVGAPVSSTDMGLWYSSDNGTSWSKRMSGNGVYALAVNNNDLYAAEFDGIYVTGNLGRTWTDVSTGLVILAGYEEPVISLAVSNGYLFAGSPDDRVWRRPLSEITALHERSTLLPVEFSISQNYPNPFNPSTMINYQLPVSKHVTLKVYDILGREVETLVNGFKSAGSYEVEFDGSRLSSGVYFYRLTAPGINIARKMLLEK
jgi:hypothetical protein